jgi:hypothetical protein
VDFSRVQGHQQVTDLYLLALAVRDGGTLAGAVMAQSIDK